MDTLYLKPVYLPAGGVRLLSPQHFAQQSGDLTGTETVTNGHQVTLHWQKHSASLTSPLSPMDNVSTFHLALGFINFETYCQQAKIDNQTSTVLDNEMIHELDLPTNGNHIRPWGRNHYPLDGAMSIRPNMLQSQQTTKVEQEYLQLHNSLGHIHPDRMQLMVQQGTLPARFKNCRMPFCVSCAFGKSSRKPWHSHSTSNIDKSIRPQRPGECISVDQLISPTPGFTAQMSGKLTTQRYTCATIYVN